MRGLRQGDYFIGGLTFHFFIWATPWFVAINYIHEIAFYVRGYGINVPKIVMVLFLGLLDVFMIYVSAFILARWKGNTLFFNRLQK